MKRLSLSERLIFNFLFIGIVVISIVSTYSFYSTRNALKERAFNQLSALRINKQAELTHFFEDRLLEAQYISQTITDNKLLPFTQEEGNSHPSHLLQNNILESGKYYDCLCIIEGTRVIIDSLGQEDYSTHLISNTVTPWQSIATKYLTSEPLEPFISDYFIYKNRIISPMVIAPIISNGKPVAYVALSLFHHSLQNIMFENNPLKGMGESGETYLVGSDRLMRSASRFIPGSLLQTEVSALVIDQAESGVMENTIILDYRGVEVLSSFGALEVPGLEWIILSEIDLSETIAPIKHVKYNIIMLSVIISMGLFLFALFISRRITSPIRQLTLSVEHISKNEPVEPMSIDVEDEIGKLIAAFNTMALKIAEQKVKIRAEKFGRLRSILDGQEMERQRLSREIHDGLGQNLIAIKMKLESIKGMPQQDQDIAIRELALWFDKTIEEIRRMSNNLIPEELNSYGLVRALGNFLTEVQENTGIRTVYHSSGIQDINDNKTKTYLFRIVQEAVSNSISHATPTTIEVALTGNAGVITLTITDDGKGFSVVSNEADRGNGIINMRERTNLLNGTFSLNSNENSGTTITISIPCEKCKYE